MFWFCSDNQEQLSKSLALLVKSPKIITTAPQCMRDPSVRYQICLLSRVLSQTIMNTLRSTLQSRYCNNILVFTKHIDTIYSIISHFPTPLQDTYNICNSEHLILRYRHKFLRYSVDSLDDVFNVDFISKFSLSVLQKYSLAGGKNKLFWSAVNDLKP